MHMWSHHNPHAEPSSGAEPFPDKGVDRGWGAERGQFEAVRWAPVHSLSVE